MDRVLAIDVGIRTMSICILDKSLGICLWNIYDILEDDSLYCISCGRNAKYRQNSDTFCGLHVNKKDKKVQIKKKKVCEYSLQQIACKIIKKINAIIDENSATFKDVKCCILELQPRINGKMKFTSHILYCKLCELFLDTNCIVKFERASQKLKKYKFNKGGYKTNTYKNRKAKSIEYVSSILEDKKIYNCENYIDFFKKAKKKDDMSDCFLMAFNSLC